MQFDKDPREAEASPEPEADLPAGAHGGQEPEQAPAEPEEFSAQGLGPYREDGSFDYEAGQPAVEEAAVPAAPTAGGEPPAPPPPRPKTPEEEEEEQMLRMSFLEHLEELRARIIKALAGIGIAFLFSLIFANKLWLIISEPAADALRQIGIPDPRLAQIKPMEVFSIVWVKLPMLTAIFLASPWVLYQAWAFIAPGLYRRERRWAGPFIVCSAGLFILGGLFAYFVAFRFGLVFLLGIGRDIRIQPIVSVTEYFDLFVNVILGVGLVFELPVLIFFLTLLRIVSPRFLLRNSRYAILIIVVIAALITPTPDVFNLMLFSVPMVLLYFVGVFASYLLVLHREGRRFPWRKVAYAAGGALVAAGAALWLALTRYGYHLVPHWPFLAR
ncbi:MAG: twin-arginine translocase subunit TatC [Bryobacterales bacterium]|nr:twin-arginine translocase subunit TatC [Bryobacteraceae bacterium]MDW8131367.1 twin-arginine translocase subunit TatC [Bryobacterales bacterium]